MIRICKFPVLFCALVLAVITSNPAPAAADKQKACEAYARAGIAGHNKNVEYQCGFTEAHFDNNYSGHYNWCLTASNQDVQSAIAFRSDKLRKCVGPQKKKAFQAAYCKKAATATQAWRAAVAEACKGLPDGNEWQDKWQQDYDSCIKKGGSWADRQNAERKKTASACTQKKRTKTFTVKDKLRHNTGRYGWLAIDVCNNKDRGPGTEGLYNTCGKKWANELCKRFGYRKVTEIGPTPANDQRTGWGSVKADRPSTWWAGSKKICHGKCYYFSSITCTK